MIIREYLKCETCGHPHIMRVGMGQEEYHSHTFSCRGCGERIKIALNTDYKNISAWITFEENAVQVPPLRKGDIVNLDANFVIPESEQGKEFAFPRLVQIHNMFEAQKKYVGNINIASSMLARRNNGRPDFKAEWTLLKKAWSLKRNGHEKLALRKMKEANGEYYGDDQLDGLQDWLWRLASQISGPEYDGIFVPAQKEILRIGGLPGFDNFAKFYVQNLLEDRQRRYFELMREFFEGYSEYSQVLFLVNSGAGIPEQSSVSSKGFEQTKMFYGNAFETLASNADILALLNNMAAGRGYDAFEHLKLKEYYKLDKSGRFAAFEGNAPFANICSEADNQIRNASHHGSFDFDERSGTIFYRAGKGGQGDVQQVSYTEYLERSAKIFLQVITLLRLELMMHTQLSTAALI
jgi:hypothetical protein